MAVGLQQYKVQLFMFSPMFMNFSNKDSLQSHYQLE